MCHQSITASLKWKCKVNIISNVKGLIAKSDIGLLVFICIFLPDELLAILEGLVRQRWHGHATTFQLMWHQQNEILRGREAIDPWNLYNWEMLPGLATFEPTRHCFLLQLCIIQFNIYIIAMSISNLQQI